MLKIFRSLRNRIKYRIRWMTPWTLYTYSFARVHSTLCYRFLIAVLFRSPLLPPPEGRAVNEGVGEMDDDKGAKRSRRKPLEMYIFPIFSYFFDCFPLEKRRVVSVTLTVNRVILVLVNTCVVFSLFRELYFRVTRMMKNFAGGGG